MDWIGWMGLEGTDWMDGLNGMGGIDGLDGFVRLDGWIGSVSYTHLTLPTMLMV